MVGITRSKVICYSFFGAETSECKSSMHWEVIDTQNIFGDKYHAVAVCLWQGWLQQLWLPTDGMMIEGSLEVKLPTVWTNGEAEKWRIREEKKNEKIREEKEREKRRGRCAKRYESRDSLCFSNDLGAPEGRTVGLLKRRVRSRLAGWETNNCAALWREAHLQVKMLKTPHVLITFGSWDVEKVHAATLCGGKHTWNQNVKKTFSEHFWKLDVQAVHAVVARSTCPSQNVQSTLGSDHFWQLACRKSARGCGAKTCKNMMGMEHFWTLRCRFVWQAQGIVHLVKSEQNVRDCGSFNYNHHYTTLRYSTTKTKTKTTTNTTIATTTTTTLHYTTLHFINYTTLRYTTLHCASLNCTTAANNNYNYKFNCNYTNYTTHHTTVHYPTLQIQLQLRYFTLH